MKYDCGSGVVGNSIDIRMECDDPSVEVRADIRVDEFSAKRLWGQILNCRGEAIPNSLVKLVRVRCIGGKKEYEGIAHTITDCEGFYQFDVCQEEGACYKIIVNKAVRGPEKIIETGGGNCHACEDGYGYDACKSYPPIIEDYMPCECQDSVYMPKSECPCVSKPSYPCPPKPVCPCPPKPVCPCPAPKPPVPKPPVPCPQPKPCHCDEKKQKPKCNYASYTR